VNLVAYEVSSQLERLNGGIRRSVLNILDSLLANQIPAKGVKNGGMLISQPISRRLTNHSELCMSRLLNNQPRRISIYRLQRRLSFGFELSSLRCLQLRWQVVTLWWYLIGLNPADVRSLKRSVCPCVWASLYLATCLITGAKCVGPDSWTLCSVW